jgi:DNA-binding NarL/FixJ family response regulator
MPTKALKTYLVEDSAIVRQNLTELLEESAPVQVVGGASDELTALEWVRDRSHQCDLVIVDIFLKGGSGLGVLRDGAGIEQPAKWVVLSNHTTKEMRDRCIELGADRVFDKSNEIDQLLLYCKELAGETDLLSFSETLQ